MSEQQHILVARTVGFAYRPQQPVLRDVDLSAAPGRLIGVLGPNGSGKTTLLRCLLRQLRPDTGTILLDGKELRKHSSRQLARLLAYVPQSPQSAFAFTVRQLVLMGRFAHTGVLGLAGEHDLAVARQAMIMTETLGFADRTLEELSGGEAQRVMIARALSQQPAVMLLDEPTSHLDIRNQLMIYRMMQRLAHDWKMAVVCVSHDINLASRFADELVLMREGVVIASGAPKAVLSQPLLQEAYEVNISFVEGPCGETLIFPR